MQDIILKNNIGSDFLIDTNGFSAEGGVARKRCVIHPCGQAWSVVYNVSWVEAGEGEGTTMMTTMMTTMVINTLTTILSIIMTTIRVTINHQDGNKTPIFFLRLKWVQFQPL